MGISLLLYGKAGSGKSILASTFPKPLILDADGGHKIYQEKKMFPEAKYVGGKMVFAGLQKAVSQIKAGENEFETLVIDSLTNLENMAITSLKGLGSNNWETGLYSNKGKKLYQDDWGAISGSTIAILTELRAYPINVVIITQLGVSNDGGVQKYVPQLVGKGEQESLHFSDIVGYMEVVEGTDGNDRLLHLTSTSNDKFTAKSRLGISDIPPMRNPSYEKIAELIKTTKVDLSFE